ncbi:lysophospholipid acyltransferase family protein [Thermodesulfobacteriota bacterium]
MERKHFWHILKTDLAYLSPPKRHVLVENLAGWPTFIFYTRLLKTVYMNSVIARRGNLDRNKWADASFEVFKLVESAGGKFNISGIKGLTQQKRPRIYIANHMSMIDTLILPCLTLSMTDVTFVVKESLLRYPLFGEIIRARHPIAVSRRNPREDFKTVLSKGQDFISNNYSIVIFPQATRSSIFDAASFNSLGVKLARKAGVPVIPIALKTDFQGNGRIVKEMGPIDPRKILYFKFGDPLEVEGKGQVTHRKVVEFIERNLKAWGGQVSGVPGV